MKKIIARGIIILFLLVFIWGIFETAVQSTESSKSGEVIVIDPGHGGEDPGVVGVNGIKEKEINLEIAGKLKESLEAQGFQVILTRTEDVGLYEENSHHKKAQDMQNRIKMIAENKPILAISIHQNSYADASVTGPQVFYYDTSIEGKKLAEILQKNLNEKLEVQRPRVAKSNSSYYLLKRSNCILNIIECGFLTNPEEAVLLKKESYQKKIADSIAEAVKLYLIEN